MADPFESPTDRAARPFALSVERGGAGPAERPHLPAEPPAMGRHAAEWGLASLLAAGFAMMFAPLSMIFSVIFWINGDQIFGRANRAAIGLTVLAVTLGALVVLALCGASLAIGVRALQWSARSHQPAGLLLAGVLASGVALVLCLFAGAGMVSVVMTFTR